MFKNRIFLFTGLALVLPGATLAADFTLNSSSSDPVLIDAQNTGSTNKTHLNVVSGTPNGVGAYLSLGDGTGSPTGVNAWINGSSPSGVSLNVSTAANGTGVGLSSNTVGNSNSTVHSVYGHATGIYGATAYGVYGDVLNYGAAFAAAGYFNGDAWAYSFPTISDRKFKQDIRDVTGGLDKILALKPRTYTYKTEEFKGKMNFDNRSHIGFIAQEVEAVLPELVLDGVNATPLTEAELKAGVKKEPVRFKGVDYTGVIPVLVKAVQEQQAEIASLRAEVASLKAAK